MNEENALLIVACYQGIESARHDFHTSTDRAHADNPSFQRGTQRASHLGGTQAPMVGRVRIQFADCIDIVPTLLEAIGLPEPASVDGLGQQPMNGTSLIYTVDDTAAEDQRSVQYFDNVGSRAIDKDGWWAAEKALYEYASVGPGAAG